MIGGHRIVKQGSLYPHFILSRHRCVPEFLHPFMPFCYHAVSIAIIVSLAGCVSGPDDAIVLPPIDTSDSFYELKVAEAWIRFESADYNGSILTFGEALDMDPLRSDAYLGLGWCYAMIDDLQNSVSNFQVVIEKDSAGPDGYASIAFVYLAQNEYAKATAAADRAILLGGEEYVFHHIPEVETRNLRLLIAECYYAAGQYAEAQAQVDILQPGGKLDPNSITYKQDLLLEIENLRWTGPVLDELSN